MVVVNNRLLCINASTNTDKYNKFCTSHLACFKCICRGFITEINSEQRFIGGTYLIMREETQLEN